MELTTALSASSSSPPSPAVWCSSSVAYRILNAFFVSSLSPDSCSWFCRHTHQGEQRQGIEANKTVTHQAEQGHVNICTRIEPPQSDRGRAKGVKRNPHTRFKPRGNKEDNAVAAMSAFPTKHFSRSARDFPKVSQTLRKRLGAAGVGSRF